MTWLMLDRGFSFAWHTTAVLAFNDAKQVTTCRQFLRSRTLIELGKWREMGLWWVWHGYRRGIRWGMMGYKAWLLHTSSILFPHSHTLNTWSLHMTCHQIFLRCSLRMFRAIPKIRVWKLSSIFLPVPLKLSFWQTTIPSWNQSAAPWHGSHVWVSADWQWTTWRGGTWKDKGTNGNGMI